MLQATGRRAAARGRTQSGARHQPAATSALTRPRTPIRSPRCTRAALATASTPSRASARLDSYAASAVMVNATGEPVALLDAQLPAAEFDRSAASYRNGVICWSALAVARAAGIAGILYGLWLAAPVVRAGRDGAAHRPRRFQPGGAHRRAARTRRAGAGDGRHAPQPDRADRHAAPPGGRGAAPCWPASSRAYSSPTSERRIVYANPQFLRSAPGAGAAIHRPLLRRRAAPAPPPARAALRARLPDHRGTRSTARRAAPSSCGSADGTVRSTIVVSSAPADGRQVQLLRDETELEAVRRARDSVLGNISHEFRTPLAAQLASIEMLRDGLGP